MTWLSRLLMTPTERRLTDRAQFRASVDADAVAAELRADPKTLPELTEYMLDSLAETVRAEGGLSIDRLERRAEASREALADGHPAWAHDILVAGSLGDTCLLEHLVRRANALTESRAATAAIVGATVGHAPRVA